MIITILSSPDENVIVLTIDPGMIEAAINAAAEEKQRLVATKWDTDKNKSATLTLNEE